MTGRSVREAATDEDYPHCLYCCKPVRSDQETTEVEYLLRDTNWVSLATVHLSCAEAAGDVV